MSNFTFLAPTFPTLHAAASDAERHLAGDPRAACFYARRAVEVWVDWLYTYDHTLNRPPGEDNLITLLGRFDFRRAVPQAIQDKAHLIRKNGNQAIHTGYNPTVNDALLLIKELFQLLRWHAHRYAPPATQVDVPDAFDPRSVPPAPDRLIAVARAELKNRQAKLEAEDARRRELEAQNAALQAQIAATQARIADIIAANAAAMQPHDYAEADTRTLIIDTDLREAGWEPAAPNVREYPVTGMPDTPNGNGKVDYVLWGDDGLPLAVIEAKRTTHNATVGRQQAALYADCLQAMTGQRPVIFYTNGYEINLWDDAAGPAGDPNDVGYAPRRVQGYYNKDDLQRMVNRRGLNGDTLRKTSINPDISGRHYQRRAIARVGERFASRHRTALLHMATGTGKTRTTIGLIDVLLRAGWIKRVLFLADRTALVSQAEKAFRAHLPDNEPVNLLDLPAADRATARNARIVVSTYHTILNRLEARLDNGEREYGVGHFDLIVIDEAHRSVFRKFRAIFDYFDAQLIGLTATPVAEIDRNTYELFGLPDFVPTDSYDLAEAVGDGFLVEPKIVAIDSLIMTRGLKYSDLTPEEQARWDDIDWGEETPPDEIRAAEINKYLFNQDTVDKVLARLMQDGLHVAGGDRLGKTIIFARNQQHAEYIEERFNANYPYYGGHFARTVSYKEPRSESLINQFKQKESAPHIAISVDMLDTGIDVPEVVNLVFFKPVYSRTKFDQMIGRGTRLCPDLFGPGEDKQYFVIFDLCGNFDYFENRPQESAPAQPPALRDRIFRQRAMLIDRLQQRGGQEHAPLLAALRDQLHARVSAMPADNFMVRPQREWVDRLRERAAWDGLGPVELAEATERLGDLPSAVDTEESEEMRRFDLLLLQLQLALLAGDSAWESLSARVRDIAANLETKATIPMVQPHLPLLAALQTDAWWQDATLDMLEEVRERLRALAQFIDKGARQAVYTNFADALSDGRAQRHDQFSAGVDRRQFRARVERFIRESEESNYIVKKIVSAVPLTEGDLAALEDYFYSADATGSRAEFERNYGPQPNLAAFVRSITGIDRAVAKQLFAEFLDGTRYSADQIAFVDFIINHLVEEGAVEIDDFYDAPYTYLHIHGPDGLFDADQIGRLFAIVDDVQRRIRPGA